MIRNNAQLLIPHVNKGKLMSASPLKLVAVCKFFVSFNISFFCCFSFNYWYSRIPKKVCEDFEKFDHEL